MINRFEAVSAYRLPSPIAEHEPHRVWSQFLPVPTKITVPHTTARASLLLVPGTHLILTVTPFIAIVPYHPFSFVIWEISKF